MNNRAKVGRRFTGLVPNVVQTLSNGNATCWRLEEMGRRLPNPDEADLTEGIGNAAASRGQLLAPGKALGNGIFWEPVDPTSAIRMADPPVLLPDWFAMVSL